MADVYGHAILPRTKVASRIEPVDQPRVFALCMFLQALLELFDQGRLYKLFDGSFCPLVCLCRVSVAGYRRLRRKIRYKWPRRFKVLLRGGLDRRDGEMGQRVLMAVGRAVWTLCKVVLLCALRLEALLLLPGSCRADHPCSCRCR